MMFIEPENETRAAYITGLRMLANLLENHPDIPHYPFGISFALGGTEEEAFAVIESAAQALTAAGVPFERRNPGHYRAIELVLEGLCYSFSRMHDVRIAENNARRSYEPSVKVDDAALQEVA